MNENGRIKFFNLYKRWGFIIAEDGSELFFHASDILDFDDIAKLQTDDKVTFTKKTDDPRGVSAILIRRA